jgi:hypothetical protein
LTVIAAGLPCRRSLEAGLLLALPSRVSSCQAKAPRYAPRAGRVVGVAVERACRDGAGQQGGAKRTSQLAPDLGDDVTWRKSSYSTYNGNCVEVAVFGSGEIGVRDSKDRLPGRRALTFSAAEWSEFLSVVRTTEPRLH